MLKIANIVGARPNFMKIAPIHKRMQKSDFFAPLLIHTGQHYDEKMSTTFFVELGMPKPDLYLGVGSGSHAEQTAAVMIGLEKIFIEQKPDWIIVVGDVNSTIAASLAAAKLHIPVAHVEAGLRSFDRSMPEEINRVLTDSISDKLFVTEQSGLDNLANEGVAKEKIHFVGNVMIDSLVEHLVKSRESAVLEQYRLAPQNYVLVTLHRPSNVDNYDNLNMILDIFTQIQTELPIFFPIHPRTRKMITNFNLDDKINKMPNLILAEPLGYLPFLRLMSQAKIVITDSGGIQEETTYLGIPCLTMRENTERPITITLGTNRLVGINKQAVLQGFSDVMQNKKFDHQLPPLWDGNAAQRIVQVFENLVN
ncbi:MAG TPA: UDP-N-acetylglucosamine 2-epimerase (non-hydrolyzing) [bacterium]|nr:UDP-N-acetylglucosamine 2-epimerase (non-hydrolyzing) [bacterium]HPN42771.1 UDP-N-acetylglucosamine 2-epimerase (non-hydrolyzing) [bacterium]